jgi:3-oxoacyl-[acyl-carrier protein] reductase
LKALGPLGGKTAIVTGGSKGIGSAIARALARDGAAVIINYAHDKSAAEAIVTDITAAGARVLAVASDVSRPDAAATLFARCLSHFGRPDILVCNAGVSTVLPLEQTTTEEYERIFDINVRGLLFLLKEAATQLNDYGRIITLSSSVVASPRPGVALYASSKAAVKAMTEVAALELGPRGITVNCLLPGLVDTPMIKDMPAEYRQTAAQNSPFGRIGMPDDIAGIVAFLASDASRWITGQSIVANGGARR